MKEILEKEITNRINILFDNIKNMNTFWKSVSLVGLTIFAMNNAKRINLSQFQAVILLTAILAALKTSKKINCSWWLVFIPILTPFIMFIAFCLIIAILATIL